jgi:hypothetical protein
MFAKGPYHREEEDRAAVKVHEKPVVLAEVFVDFGGVRELKHLPITSKHLSESLKRSATHTSKCRIACELTRIKMPKKAV